MTLSPAELDALADRVWDAARAGDRFPAVLAGISYEDGLALQVRLLRLHEREGAVLSGWKVGLTSARARDAFGGLDVRPFGYLDAAHTLSSGADVAVATIPKPAVETELCVTVGERIAGSGLTASAVRTRLSRVAAGYEINQRPPGTLTPDLAMGAVARMYNWGIVEGSGCDPGAVDLNGVVVSMTVLDADGETLQLQERAADHVDDHYESIARLAAALDTVGLALEPGQKIITGAVGRFPARPGQTWRSEFSGVGSVEVRFT
jgi:2-keto-4-pentenoate hydratase